MTSSLLAHVEMAPRDPILGVTEAFVADKNPKKVNLGVGIYYDDTGKVPVLECVRRAERDMAEKSAPRAYLPIDGLAAYDKAIQTLVFGADNPALKDNRVITVQTLGGTGGLKVGADFLRRTAPDAQVWISDPSWENHRAIFENAGFTVNTYPYYDAPTHGVKFSAMLDCLKGLPAGAIVLLHACCHNPTGADLDAGQWVALAGVIESRGLVPFVDLAYQGFGDDLETDVQGLRLLATRVPQLLLALSCSKNFGLYRERTGALAVIAENATAAAAIATHQARTARRMYSMPPDHGAAIVACLLGDRALRAAWESELAGMVSRMKALRELLAGHLAARRPDRDFSWVTRHRGMFSLAGLGDAAIGELRSKHHVYVPPDGRINIAGVSATNVDRVADSIVAVMG